MTSDGLATGREVLIALDLAERGAVAEQQRPSGLLTVTVDRELLPRASPP